jgi:hypothetical protein
MPSHEAQYTSYGALPQHLEAGHGHSMEKEISMLKKRRGMGVIGMCGSLFVPWIFFSILYADVAFSLHYKVGFLCWLMVAVAAFFVLAVGALAFTRVVRQDWLLFFFFSCMLAVVTGPVLGDLNFWTNTQPYYELQTLNEYVDVNPARAHGQQMMDAGKITFAAGAFLDLNRSWLFQDLDTYCAAPVSLGSSVLTSFDFWAIGLNCCERKANIVEFKCGQYTNATAGQGLRLMNQYQQDYYRLAVQQAEAKYKIKAEHPIFFYWTEDASGDMQSYWDIGSTYYTLGVIAFFILQLFLIILALVLFSKFEF